MKLLRLEIKNLASLDNPEGEVIDFERGALGECNIFSIVGPTGSGKSTILDAICLALYGRAPRYPRKKGARNQGIEIYGTPDSEESSRLAPTDSRNILTRGAKEGYSKLTFQANDGKIYRAEWHVRFLRRRYDNVVTQLYILAEEGGITVELNADWASVPDIIGLDYEQFLRTVLIAQGSFASFLTATEEERYALLEKLIGCEDTYSRLSEDIKISRQDAVNAFNVIDSEIKAVSQSIMQPDELKSCIESKDAFEKEEKELEASIKALEGQLKWYAENEKLEKELKESEENLAKRKADLEAMAPAIDRLNIHTNLTPAITMMREMERLKNEEEKFAKLISTEEAEIKFMAAATAVCEEDLVKLKDKAAKSRQELTDIEPRIKLARILKERSAEIRKKKKEVSAELADKKKSLAAAQKEIEENEAKINEWQTAVAKASEELKEIVSEYEKKKESLIEALRAKTEQLDDETLRIDGQNIETLQENKEKASERKKILADSIRIIGEIAALEKSKAQNESRTISLEKSNQTISLELKSMDLESLQKDVDVLSNLHTLMTSENWRRHRSLLHEGEPCPLCGALEHPYSENVEKAESVFSDTEKLLAEKKRLLEEAQRRSRQFQDLLKTNEGELKSLKANIANAGLSLQSIKASLIAMRQNSPWLPETVEQMEETADRCDAEEKKASEALSFHVRIQKNVSKLQKEKDKAQQKITDLEKEFTATQEAARKKVETAATSLAGLQALAPTLLKNREVRDAECKDIEAKLARVSDEENATIIQFDQQLDGADPDKVEEKLKTDIDNADKEVKAKEGSLTDLKTTLAAKRGQLSELEKRKGEVAAQSKTTEVELDKWTSEYNESHAPVDSDVIKEFMLAKDDWAKVQSDKERLSADVHAASVLHEKSAAACRSHQDSKPEKEKEEIVASIDELNGKSRKEELTALLVRIRRHEEAERQLGGKLDEYNSRKQDKEDWEAISSAIGADGKTLRKVAQCYTLGFLIRHANQEIHRFNRRYELMQVKNSLGIRVIDHDRADDIRDTTSLSGGETFIVSLGLALGLSSLSSRNVSFGNLFIDEGFGTLDADTLATVIDSLAMLQTSQGKKVGIISHTDTMSERISTQIRIVKKGNTGSSRIEISAN